MEPAAATYFSSAGDGTPGASSAEAGRLPPTQAPCPHFTQHHLVAGAARSAVEAAFAELQPALLQNIRHLAESLLDVHPPAERREWHDSSGVAKSMPVPGEEAHSSAERLPSKSLGSHVEKSSRPSVGSHDYECLSRQLSMGSGVLSPSTTMYSLDWPAVPNDRALDVSGPIVVDFAGMRRMQAIISADSQDGREEEESSRPRSSAGSCALHGRGPAKHPVPFAAQERPRIPNASSDCPEKSERSRRNGEQFLVSRQLSGRSVASSSATIYSRGRPTVQSLQADVAVAVLERSGLGPLMHHSRGSSQRHAAGATRDRAHVVPEPDEGGGCGGAWGAFPKNVGSANDLGDAARYRNPTCPAPSASWMVSRQLTGSQVFQARVDELAHQASFSKDSSSRHAEVPISRSFAASPVPTALRIAGVLEWDAGGRPRASAICQGMARASILSAAASFVVLFAAPPGLFHTRCQVEDVLCHKRVDFLSEVCLPLGAVLVQVPFGLRRHRQRLEETFWIVRGVSLQRRYEIWEARRQRWDTAVFIFIWPCSMITAGVGEHLRGKPVQIALSVSLTGIFSGVILCLAYAVARICRSLIVMLDTFCCDVVGSLPLPEVAHVWNLTQAVLRKASTDVESSLVVLCIFLAFSVPVLAVDVTFLGMRGEDLPRLLPGFCVRCGILYSFLLAAMVSEKSARIPALINAVSFGPGTDVARQQTVDYVASSAAGFYVVDMRVTTSRVVKFVYVWCLAAMGVLTQLAAAH